MYLKVHSKNHDQYMGLCDINWKPCNWPKPSYKDQNQTI